MEDDIKDYLFGHIAKAPQNKSSRLDKEKMKEVLKAGAKVASFCKGCGFVQGFSTSKANEIAGIFNINLPESLDSLFFESDRCNLCANDFSEVKINKYR